MGPPFELAFKRAKTMATAEVLTATRVLGRPWACGTSLRAPMEDGSIVVLFDGTCAFCEGSVKFIARRDPAGRSGSARRSPRRARLCWPSTASRAK